MDGVDPCSLLTPEQRAELGLTSEPKTHKSTSSFFRGDVTACTIRGPYPDVVLLGVSTVTTAGIERWSEGDVAATLRPMSVAGFPAVVAKPDRFADYCNVEVDVAPSQLLDVQFGGGSAQAPISQDELCDRARRSAALMMETLLAR